MVAVVVRNLPEETHRALKARAAEHGRSTEAEIRAIIEAAVRPPARVKLGTLLKEIGRQAGLQDDDLVFERDRFPRRADEFRVIVLDTNVVSEAMKPSAHPAVIAWLNAQAAETVYLSSVTLAEILFGIAILPPGRRKGALAAAIEGLTGALGPRVLPFDAAAARIYAEVAAAARTAGKGFPLPDGYIAAIAASRGFTVATRDDAPFVAAGVGVINPWVEL